MAVPARLFRGVVGVWLVAGLRGRGLAFLLVFQLLPKPLNFRDRRLLVGHQVLGEVQQILQRLLDDRTHRLGGQLLFDAFQHGLRFRRTHALILRRRSIPGMLAFERIVRDRVHASLNDRRSGENHLPSLAHGIGLHAGGPAAVCIGEGPAEAVKRRWSCRPARRRLNVTATRR